MSDERMVAIVIAVGMFFAWAIGLMMGWAWWGLS